MIPHSARQIIQVIYYAWENLKNNESCNGYLFNHFWLFITLFDCYHTDFSYYYKRHMFARF